MDASNEARKEDKLPGAVLFMCGMNSIRSPIAEAIARHYLPKSVYVASAGVRRGERDPFVDAVLDEIGLNLGRHQPHVLDDLVAFRVSDGTAGVMDERCPHRKTSMALARNEGNQLRCIYHGWTFAADGTLTSAPNHAGDQERFCKAVKLNKYKVEERGGIVWVWLGKGEAPAFPRLPFTDLPENQRSVTSQEVPTNWLQGVEASMDSSHVSFLHETTTKMSGPTDRQHMTTVRAPRFEFEDRPYGFRYASMRDLEDNRTYARVNNFVMPWYGIICAPEATGPSTVFFSVPVDDTHHRAWFVHFNIHRELGMTALSATPDVWAWPPLPPGDAKDNWGQNRDLMARGHFSGFPQHLGTEDFAMFLGQGEILDRSDEQLCSADAALVRLRKQLLQSVREFQEGKRPTYAPTSEDDYRKAISIGRVMATSDDWKSLA